VKTEKTIVPSSESTKKPISSFNTKITYDNVIPRIPGFKLTSEIRQAAAGPEIDMDFPILPGIPKEDTYSVENYLKDTV
jgi:hypothetical protein